jgi:hypothetical protein
MGRKESVVMLDIETAQMEIRTKSKAQIEAETAWTWASRAVACYYEASSDRNNAVSQAKWLRQAEDYAHEAREHASQVRDGARTLLAVEAALAEVVG